MQTNPSEDDETGEGGEGPTRPVDPSGPETASLPIDFCGDAPPNEGDIISVKVVSVDADNGSFDVVCVPKATAAPRGIKAAVSAMKGGV